MPILIKRNICSLLLFGFIVIFFINCRQIIKNEVVIYPRSEKGVLDLRNWDFNKMGTLHLEGDWEFYWQQLYTPDDFINQVIKSPPIYYEAIIAWNDMVINNEQLSEDGFATFRIVVKLPANNMNYSFYIRNQDSAYKLWINGQLLAQNGQVGKKKADHIPQRLPLLFHHYAKNKELEMVIQISNFSHRRGGLVNFIKMGLPDQIMTLVNIRLGYSLFMFGSLFIMFLYHLGLFILRRQNKSTLFFGVFCLLGGIRIIISGDYIFYQIFPSFPWHLGVKIEFISAYLCLLFFGLFFYSLFSKDIPKWFLGLVTIFSCFSCLFTLLFSIKIASFLINVYQVYTVITCIILIIFLLKIIYYRRAGSIVFLSGFIILFFTLVFDFYIDDKTIIGKALSPLSLFSFGVFIFIFSQSFLLSLRFSRAFQQLDDLSINLEKKVSRRTKELKDANLKLETAEKEKTNFFINLSHEIKTPLTVISNYLEELPDLDGNNDLKIIKYNVEKLKRDMINFFDILKIERGQIIYNNFQIVNLSDFINNKIDFFKKFAANAKVDIKHDISPGLYLKTPITLLDRIFNNLIQNAIKYNKPDGKIFISAILDKQLIQVIIKDTGCGIEKEHLENIFKPYYQITHHKKNIDGIGMGLTIVKNGVELLNGTITVESEINQYSQFQIFFPFYKLENGDSIAEFDDRLDYSGFLVSSDNLSGVIEDFTDNYANYSYDSDKKKKTILIVEDNKELLYLMKRNLSNSYNVYICFNGEEALEKLNNHPLPDLIISDIMMDKIDGFELLEKIGENEKWNLIPFIFITAKTRNNDRLNGLRKGAIDYIYKPFSISELIHKINSILRYQELNMKFREQQKFAAVGMMLGGISHEIFNPLSGISGPLANIKKIINKSGDANIIKLDKHIDYIKSSVMKITSIIQVLKELTSNNQMESTIINIENLVTGIITGLNNFNKDKIKLIFNITNKNKIIADEKSLLIILRNLLQNACDAISDAGEIRIHVLEDDVNIIIRIEDTGTGIETAEIEKVFQAFYTTKLIQKGSGLGLFIVKQLVAKMNWEIAVNSIKNKGTVFSLSYKK